MLGRKVHVLDLGLRGIEWIAEKVYQNLGFIAREKLAC